MQAFKKDERQPDSRLDSASLVLSLSATLLILFWALRYCSFGFDLTDESFYLIWISNPFLYDVSVSQFGFVLHPVYELLGGDIASLRRANILVTYVLSWAFVVLFLRSLTPRISIANPGTLIVAAAFATTSLILFDSWLLMPSYNSLTLQALLIAAIGLLLAHRVSTAESVLGWTLLAAGGWLAFMAKPTTAAAVSILALIYLSVARRISVRNLLFGAVTAVALVVASAWMTDGSIHAFVRRILTGADLAHILGDVHSTTRMLRVDSFRVPVREQQAILAVVVASSIATGLAYVGGKLGRAVSVVVAAACVALAVSLAFGAIHRGAGFGAFQGMTAFGIVISAIAVGVGWGWRELVYGEQRVPWGTSLTFLLMPHIYAFGTSGNYWKAGSSAAIFWVLAGVAVLGPLAHRKGTWSFAIPLGVAAQALTAVLVQTGIERPYRQPEPIMANDTTVEIGPSGSRVRLTDDFARYFGDAKLAAKQAGFRAGTPMIDLSGQSPGILFALGAESIGQAWIIGGYPKSPELAKAILGRVPCEKLANAWVLSEPDGPRSLPDNVLQSLGLQFSQDYTLVGSWRTAEGAGGYKARREQYLYAPIPKAQSRGVETCQSLRNEE